MHRRVAVADAVGEHVLDRRAHVLRPRHLARVDRRVELQLVLGVPAAEVRVRVRVSSCLAYLQRRGRRGGRGEEVRRRRGGGADRKHSDTWPTLLLKWYSSPARSIPTTPPGRPERVAAARRASSKHAAPGEPRIAHSSWWTCRCGAGAVQVRSRCGAGAEQVRSRCGAASERAGRRADLDAVAVAPLAQPRLHLR